MQHIAITGGTGFVGRYVLASLLQRNVKVTALVRTDNALQGIEAPNLRVIKGAIGEQGPEGALALDTIAQADALIHLAWSGLPNYESRHHYETELPNQYEFLKGLVSKGLKKIVAIGTCFEYGLQSGELSEETPTIPGNPYGFAKDCLRKQLEFLAETEHFGLTWARLFYPWGNGQSLNSLYPQLCEAISRGDETFNMSGGQQIRDFLPVCEVAKCIVSLAIDAPPAGVVNICSGEPISVERIVCQWLKEKNTSIKLNLGHYPYPNYEPMEFWGSAEKLKRSISPYCEVVS